MSKCTFIIPYYGNFPNYFQLFLNSCKYNSDFEWLILPTITKVMIGQQMFMFITKHLRTCRKECIALSLSIRS